MLSLLIAAVLMHPVHETVAEIEWNAKNRCLEVSLRLDSLDEQWLEKSVGRGEGDVADWALPYLRKKFRVTDRPRDGKQDATKYRWVGRDEEGSHVWWYFEITPPDARRPSWIDQRVLFERESDFRNRILILGQVQRRSLTLTIQRPKAKLDQTADERKASPPADRRSHLDRRRDDQRGAAGHERPVVESTFG